MSTYNSEFPFPVAFPPQPMTNVLAEWLAKEGIKQAHIAGTPSVSWLYDPLF
jgi:2,3-bisphosphoglycerate-independent phosphoglycerate mutase